VGIRRFLRRRRTLLVTLGVIVVGGYIGVNLLAYTLSYKPEACLACHIMQPYYDNWKASTHNKVSCVDCHPYRPGRIILSSIRYLTGTYELPLRSHVEDKECLLCHKPENIKNVTYKETRFNHLEHIKQAKRGKALHCTSCHYSMVQGKGHMDVDKNVCMLCHFYNTSANYNQNCTVCHGEKRKEMKIGETTFSHDLLMKRGARCIECHSETARGTGEAPEERCRECHVDRHLQASDVTRLHDVHINKNYIDCFRCHNPIEHGKDTQKFSKAVTMNCGDCHKDSHGDARSMYMGVGARGVRQMPSGMYLSKIQCTGCHTIERSVHGKNLMARAWEAKKKSCVSCHREGYDKMAEDWKTGMAGFTSGLEKIVEQYGKVLKEKKASAALLADYENIDFNMHYLKDGGGVHNIQYALEIGKVIVASVQKGYKALGVTEKLKVPDQITKQDSACLFCHASFKPEKDIQLKGVAGKFNHGQHVDMGTECTKCHDPKMHRLGGFMKGACKECHPEMKL